MREAVIAAAVRSPVGKRNGALQSVHPVDLGATVIDALREQTGISPEVVDDVIFGCVTQLGDQSSNVARFIVLAAGWPEQIPGVTINRACGSSQDALDRAADAVRVGRCDVVIAGGVEVMSRATFIEGYEPMLLHSISVHECLGEAIADHERSAFIKVMLLHNDDLVRTGDPRRSPVRPGRGDPDSPAPARS